MTQLERACRRVKNTRFDGATTAQVLNLFNRYKIYTYRQILHRSLFSLAIELNLPLADCASLVDSIATYLAPAPQNAFDLFLNNANFPNRLRTNLPTLDVALGGGLHLGSITEVVGGTGTEKREFAMTLAVQTLFNPGTNIGKSVSVLYVDAEFNFNATRLAEIAECFLSLSHFAQEYCAESKLYLEHLLTCFHVVRVDTIPEFLSKLPELCEHVGFISKIKLLIVDSIAAMCIRSEGSLTQKQHWLARVARELKLLSATYSIFLLVINRSVPSDRHGKMLFDDNWLHCIDYRLLIEGAGDTTILSIVKSPSTEFVEQPISIERKGVVGRCRASENARIQDFSLDEQLLSGLDQEDARLERRRKFNDEFVSDSSEEQ